MYKKGKIMKITNSDIVKMINILAKYKCLKLPQRISYAITRDMMILDKEYQYYAESLNTILESYKGSFVLNKKGNVTVDKTGVPVVKEESEKAYKSEINELLNIQVEIELYSISEDCFNYDDSEKYDSLSADDIILLQSIICIKNENN